MQMDVNGDFKKKKKHKITGKEQVFLPIFITPRETELKDNNSVKN